MSWRDSTTVFRGALLTEMGLLLRLGQQPIATYLWPFRNTRGLCRGRRAWHSSHGRQNGRGPAAGQDGEVVAPEVCAS